MVTTIEKFNDPQDIKNVILDMAQKKKQVVYGQQSVNIQIPAHLRRETKDYDIYTKKPEQSAKELVERLNKKYGDGKFEVVKGINKKTYKVKRGKDTVADYTGTTRKPISKKVLGVAYANIGYQKSKIKKILKDPKALYRHEKDRDTLDKINKSEMGKFLYG